MKVLFTALHLAYFRNFESVIRELAARGHQVHLAADEAEEMGGRQLAEGLAREHGTVTWGMLPSLEEEPWFRLARKLRLGLDYARFLEPRYADSPKLRARAEERAPRLVRWGAAVAPGATRAVLKRAEWSIPASGHFDRYLADTRPDVVVLTSLTYSRSQQTDLLKASRARGIRTVAAIMSWDHLSSKALVHLAPDEVLVWNETQKREAVEMHGLPESGITVTGAQCYDQWFSRAPSRSREAFCETFGLPADRPFVMWVHSALSPTPDPPEPVLVLEWLRALRESPDVRLRELGVLVRPHPERLKEWSGVDLTRYERVAFHGGTPIDAASKADYFDALYHSSAVVGLVTSAFLEAAIVGRPVLTFTLPAYRVHQDAMVHFQYLRQIGGGLLRTAPDLETHLRQLAEAVGGQAQARRDAEAFLTAFIRPFGIGQPATPRFVEALERVASRKTAPVTSVPAAPLWGPLVGVLAARSQTTAVSYLLRDRREDGWVKHRAQDDEALAVRRAAKAGRLQEKEDLRAVRRRDDARQRRTKELKHAMRSARFRAALLAHRVLAFAGLARGGSSNRFRD